MTFFGAVFFKLWSGMAMQTNTRLRYNKLTCNITSSSDISCTCNSVVSFSLDTSFLGSEFVGDCEGAIFGVE
jgi:hypothetical protein